MPNSNYRMGAKVRKCNKHATNVDLTPMVDLGFLLITFFICTTTMRAASAMQLNLPSNLPISSNLTPQSGALTILLGSNDQILYYEGLSQSNGANYRMANYKNIRTVIIDKKRRTKPKDLCILLKPSADATYSNMVAILDEMNINVIQRYALDKITAEESRYLAKPITTEK